MIGCRNPESSMEVSEEQYQKEIKEQEENDARPCVFEQTDKVITKTYPFDQSDKVELISYQPRCDGFENMELIVNGRFSVKDIQERIELKEEQIDSLFSLLYNYKTGKSSNIYAVTDCYTPRHSIVFYKQEKAIAFIEICFECGQIKYSNGIEAGELCDEKWCKWWKFLQSNNIHFGMLDNYYNCQ